MKIIQSLFIKNELLTIYLQIEQQSNNKFEAQISNEWCSTTDCYLQENGINIKFNNGKDIVEYVIDKYFKNNVDEITSEGEYFVNRDELKEISKLESIILR